MKRLPTVVVVLAAILLVAADKEPEKAKEPAPTAAQIQLWIKQLGDDSFKIREEGTRDLIKAGRVALDAVRKATKSEDAEVKQRALMILKQIKKLENAAVASIKKLRGKITVDEKSPGKPVIGLDLSHTKVTDSELVHLKWLTKLQILNLSYTKITGAGLVHLKGLSKLQKLNLHYSTKVTGANLVHLKGIINLQELDLYRARVTDADLVHLEVLPGLQTLNIGNTKVTTTGIEKIQKALPKCKISWDPEGARWQLRISKHPNKAAIIYFKKIGVDIPFDEKSPLGPVTSIRLWRRELTDAAMQHLKQFTNLQRLSLSITKISDADLALLKGFTSLQKLDLRGTKITDAGLVHLKGLAELHFLSLDGTKITDAGLVQLKGLTKLQVLGLNDTQVTGAGLVHLKGLTSLQKLDLRETKFTDAGLVHLKGLTSLQKLDLRETKVTDAGLVHLNGLTSLRELGLWGTKVTDAGLVHLNELTNLRALWLMDTQVTDAGLEHLKGLTKLQALGHRGTKITDAGLVHLKGLSKDHNSKSIYIITIRDYLKQKAAGEVFSLPLAIEQEIMKVPKIGGKFRTVFRKQYESVKGKPQKLYAVIREQLVLAERLLRDENVVQRRRGVAMAIQAADCAIEELKDIPLASNLCTNIIVPNIDVGSTTHWQYHSRESFRKSAIYIYSRTGEDLKLIEIYKMILADPRGRNAADSARSIIGHVLGKLGRYEEAIRYLEGIDPSGAVNGGRSDIPKFKKKAVLKRAAQKQEKGK